MFPGGTFGFLMSFQIAVYSFIGIELIGVTAGETKDPEKTLPKAINNVPIRILLFSYMDHVFSNYVSHTLE